MPLAQCCDLFVQEGGLEGIWGKEEDRAKTVGFNDQLIPPSFGGRVV